MIWFGSAIVITLVAIWLVSASRGASIRADQLESALSHLLQCELNQAFLSIRPKFSKYKFLQFARYEMQDGKLGVELAFPSAPWSEDYFPKVVSAASSQGLRYEVEETEGIVNRFVYVKFDDSVDLAAAFGKLVLTEIFGFDDDYRFRVRIN